MDLIEKEWTYKGETKTIYFRELTAGEQLDLARGQKFTARAGEGEMEVDMAAEVGRGHFLLQVTLVDADGKKVYRNLEAIRSEPARKITSLVKLAKEAMKGDDETNAGNA